jgi:uncharacterized protein GlcG (DUF336 family)
MTTALSLAVANRLLAVASERAATLEVLVSVAVVDQGGHLLAFCRMDGAEIAGPTLAVDKAYTSVAQSVPTSELAELAAPGGPLFGLQANGHGRYVIFAGGLPLRVDGVIVGGVGVSGASTTDDALCAEAAVRLFDEMP